MRTRCARARCRERDAARAYPAGMLSACAEADALPSPPNFPSTADFAALAALVPTSARQPHVCEANVASGRILAALLCRVGRMRYTGFEYLGRRRRNSSHVPVELPSSDAEATTLFRLFKADGNARSILLSNHARQLVAGCDVLIAVMGDQRADNRRALITDMPNVLRLLAPGGLLVMLGYRSEDVFLDAIVGKALSATQRGVVDWPEERRFQRDNGVAYRAPNTKELNAPLGSRDRAKLQKRRTDLMDIERQRSHRMQRESPDQLTCNRKRLFQCATPTDWYEEAYMALVRSGRVRSVGGGCHERGDWRWCTAVVSKARSLCAGETFLRPEWTRRALQLLPPPRSYPHQRVRVGNRRVYWRMLYRNVTGQWWTEQYQTSWRYFTILPHCEWRGDGGQGQGYAETTCLFFKNAPDEAWLGALTSRDGLAFELPPRLVMPREAAVPGGEYTHNADVFRLRDGDFLLVGGRHRPRHRPRGRNEGVFAMRSARWPYAASMNATTIIRAQETEHYWQMDERVGEETQWSKASAAMLFNGSHPGCTELREGRKMPWVAPGICEFDGRLSLAQMFDDGSYLLYARSNTARHGGGRFVQVTRSARLSLTNWSAFRPISLEDYAPGHGELYFFAVQQNPTRPGVLLALFPLVHHSRACVAMASSLDGVHWTRPTPLRRCNAIGDRGVDQPVSGGAVLDVTGFVQLYIHRDVPSISADALMSVQAMTMVRAAVERPKARITRYSVPHDAWLAWTEREVARLSYHDYHGAKGLSEEREAWRYTEYGLIQGE